MISWVAIDRISEKQKASDAEYREKMADRPMRSSARYLSDGELLAKLRSFGIELDRSSLEGLCNESLSAQEVAKPLIAKCAFKTTKAEMEGDWIWVCVDALWRRWYSDIPSFEMLDDKMQAGYQLNSSGKVEDGARAWMEAWNDILYFCDRADLRSISEFNKRFAGTQSLFNWIQDLDLGLWKAGIKDQQFLRARIAVCEETLRRFAAEDELLRENFRRSLADSYFELGDPGKADELYREWLGADPQWSWGWIGWSDCYRFTRTESKNLQKAEALLCEGLSIAGVRDREELVDRLADFYEVQGRGDEAREIRRLAGTPSAAPVTGQRQKTGRNDPCPCGSGKKFKKCCAESQQSG